MNDEMDNKVVIITGAGSGIGQAASLLFAKAGATVYGADHNEDGLGQTEKLVADEGGTFYSQRVDVSAEEDVRGLMARVEAEQGRLDIACNNAGTSGSLHFLEDYPTEQFDRVLAINLRGVFLGMKYELPLIRRSGGGAICNTASVGGLTGPAGTSAYAASKHGVYGLTRSAAHEYARAGVRVNAVAPGRTETPMVAGVALDDSVFSSAFDAEAESIPAGRSAEPIEIARAMFWLCSPAASYVYGHMLVVDGGVTIGGPPFTGIAGRDTADQHR
jgi:NAD(P)-dependent dehydrogenase (short-subunit alcohol dehydrogenase family)